MLTYTLKSIYFGVFCSAFFVLTSCSASHDSKEAVNSYLKALKQDSSSMGGEYKCIKNSLSSGRQPTNVKSWEILNQERRADDKYSDSQFDVVYVKITERDNGNFDVTNTWQATVWKSDELFEHQKRFDSDINKLIEESNKTLNDMNQFLGNSSPSPQSSASSPKRADITSQAYCVTMLKRNN